MGVHIAVAVLLWFSTLGRNYLPYSFRAGLVCFIWLPIGIVAILNIGMPAIGFMALICAWVMTSIFFNRTVTAFTMIFTLVSIALIGTALVNGWHVLPGDPALLVKKPTSWILTIAATVLVGGGLVVAISKLNESQSRLVDQTSKQARLLARNEEFLEETVAQKTRELTQEIENRKRIETEMRDSETRFRKFMEAAADRYWETDEEFRYTYVSAAPQPHSVPMTRMIGRIIWDLDGFEAGEQSWDVLLDRIEHREPIRDFRFQWQAQNGEVFFGALFATPKFDHNNEFTGYLGITTDVTDAVAARQEARSIENLFSQSLMHLQAGISLWDHDNRLVLYNDFYRWTQEDLAHMLRPGLSYEELLNARSFTSRIGINDDEREEWVQSRLDAFNTGNAGRQFRVGNRWIETHIYKIEDGSSIIFQMDVSEQKKVDEIKTDFVSLVSHELRTPLTSIYASLRLIGSQGSKIDNDTAADLIQVAERNCERLIALVNDILDLQKMVTGKLELRRETLELGEILQHTTEENQAYAQRFSVSIDYSKPEAEILVDGDSLRLKQVFTNLISNAAKFSPEGEKIYVDITETGNEAVVSVRDNGPGIPEDASHRIFDPFVQLEQLNTRETGGTGLGLPITKALVTEHGGSIEFQNGDISGTTFRITLPVVPSEQPVATVD